MKLKEIFSIAVKGGLPQIRSRMPEASRAKPMNIFEHSIKLYIDK